MSPGRFGRGAIRSPRLCFAAASALIVMNALWRSPATSGAGLLVILAGLPVYALMHRSRAT